MAITFMAMPQVLESPRVWTLTSTPCRRPLSHPAGSTMRVDLPQDLQLKILDLLPANERARLEATCKTWRELSMRSWTSVQLHCKAEEGFEAFADWLDLLAERQPGLLHTMQLHAAEVSVFVPGCLWLSMFRNLRVLEVYQTEWGEDQTYWPQNRDVISLTSLGRIPGLEHLKIVSPQSFGLCLDSSEKHEGFPQLKSLTIENLEHVDITDGFQRLMMRLESLDLSGLSALPDHPPIPPPPEQPGRNVQFMGLDLGIELNERGRRLGLQERQARRRIPPQELIQAPQLTSLKLGMQDMRKQPRRWPFQTSNRLQRLSCSEFKLPRHVLDDCTGLVALTLCYTDVLDCADILDLVRLPSLKELSATFQGPSEDVTPTGASLLQPFTRFPRLEKLHLKLLGFHHPWHPLLTPWETMPTLVELQLAPHHDLERLHIDCNLENLPSLQRFATNSCWINGPLTSPSLEVLEIDSQVPSYAIASIRLETLLGDMPQLCTLRMQLKTQSLKGLDPFLAAIKSLPALGCLVLKRQYRPAISQSASATEILNYTDVEKQYTKRQCERGFVESILEAVKGHPRLHTLSLADHQADVKLDQSELPGVRVLDIQCKGVQLDPEFRTMCQPSRQLCIRAMCGKNCQDAVVRVQWASNVYDP